MITEKALADWRTLQKEVASILSECGFAVEVEKQVKTARGEVELDVYAEETVDRRKYSLLVECKHWRNRVPQLFIHAFRTVVGDIGGNTGYIISSAGFQSGAFSAAELTNIRLLTWEEFQHEFEAIWFDKFLTHKITDELDPLMSYTEPFLPRWFEQLTEPDKQKYLELHKRYRDFGVLLMVGFSTYSRMLKHEAPTELPLRRRVPAEVAQNLGWPPAILDSVGYKEFLAAALAFGHRGIEEFRALNPTGRGGE